MGETGTVLNGVWIRNCSAGCKTLTLSLPASSLKGTLEQRKITMAANMFIASKSCLDCANTNTPSGRICLPAFRN
ncbi:hypothetical protein EGR_11243 [Echinococcus granulosus]|uniref:Uncharacterized protein n=1 Tax=Echinococcus granulosus TaxID=6210 RepID=W6TYN8_ECHGR|nr:hypothetical protein EGR_11243 [Echinococcus granulosus]EUB53900.1 hypothetical protein EGR_11243 [Echinococcus granulosus]